MFFCGATILKMKEQNKRLRIGIFIIAYNAAQTLIDAYRRIPPSLKKSAKEIYCFDDCSDDNTYYSALGYKISHKIKKFNIYKNPKNLGYGGNQKRGYRYAIKRNFDVVVMLHGDAQYAPEKLPFLLKHFISEKYDSEKYDKIGMVMGSRMMGDPLVGGMPFYKYIGNKVLTKLENLILGTNLTEFHSGYRVYNIEALKKIPFEKCSNDFHFDTEIIIMLLNAGYKIVEAPIPTYYGPGSRSYVNVFRYGIDCLKTVLEYKLVFWGFKKESKFKKIISSKKPYFYKDFYGSSHTQIAHWIRKSGYKKILDLGCAGGFLGKALGGSWKGELTGVELDRSWEGSEDLKGYKKVIWKNLNTTRIGLLFEKQEFEVITALDVLEHLKRPKSLIKQIKENIKPEGYFMVSLPNSNFLPTLILRALFPKIKMSRGPLDTTHLRFYDSNSAIKLLQLSGFKIKKNIVTSFPLPLISNLFASGSLLHPIYLFALFLSKSIPNYLGYQILFLAEPNSEP